MKVPCQRVRCSCSELLCSKFLTVCAMLPPPVMWRLAQQQQQPLLPQLLQPPQLVFRQQLQPGALLGPPPQPWWPPQASMKAAAAQPAPTMAHNQMISLPAAAPVQPLYHTFPVAVQAHPVQAQHVLVRAFAQPIVPQALPAPAQPVFFPQRLVWQHQAQPGAQTYVDAPQPVQDKARATQPKERSPVKEDIRQEGGEQQPQTPAKVAGSTEEASPQPTTTKKFVRPEIENRVFPVPGVEVMEPQEFKTLWDRMLARRSN